MERIRRTRRILPPSVQTAAHAEMQRFCELLQSFVQLAAERGDLQLRGSAAPPPLGFAVRMQPDPWSPGVELSLSLNEVRLSTWRHDGGADRTQVRQRDVALDLSGGFRWECLLFPDPDHLARTLVRRMEDELYHTS